MKRILLILVTVLVTVFNAQSQCTAPVINSFSPATGFIGSTVTISGAYFDATPANNVVYFGATKATVLTASFGTLTVTAPIGATTALISVTNACKLTAYSRIPFNGIFCQTPIDANTYNNTVFTLSSISGAYNMLTQDMDLDGKPDIVTSLNGITVALNTSTVGTISFAAYNFAGGGSHIATADFDGDGKKDIMTANNIYRNTSTGPGNISFDITSGFGGYQGNVGDFNNDGKIDIIAGTNLYRNTSTGPGNISFVFAGTVSNGATGIQCADLDGDGKTDIMGTEGGNNRAFTYRNITAAGATTFVFEAVEYWPSIGLYPYRCQMADFDKDGKIDLCTPTYSSATNTTNTTVWRNTSTVGDISFGTASNYPGPNGNYRIAVGDVDGDGYPDIVTKSIGLASFDVYRNTSSGAGNISFATRFTYPDIQGEVSGITIGDLDGDFVPDIATSGINSNSLRIHRNTSSQVDVTAPTAVCKNIVVALSPSGSVVVTAAMIDNGSSDACGIGSLLINNAASVTFTCANIGANVVTLKVTDRAGNISTCTATVTVAPAAIIVSGQTTVCQGQTVLLNANLGDSYQWQKDGVDIAGATSQTYTATVTGSYTVTVTNAGGCSGTSAPTVITVNTNPTVATVPTGTASLCPNATSLNIVASTSSIYQWKNNGVNIAGATQQNYTTTVAGTYSVQVIDLFGCTATSPVVTVSVNPTVPTISGITGNTTVCSGTPAILTAASGQSSPVFNWYTASTGGSSLFTGSAFTSPNLSANTSYFVDVTSGGCTSSARSQVDVSIVPISNQTVTAAPTVFCGSGSSTVTVASSQLGVNYTLRDNAGNAVVAGPVAGTGAALNFNTGLLSSTTTFNVLAKNDNPGAISFSGSSSSYVNRALALDVTKGFTVETWINVNSASRSNAIASQGTANLAGPFDLYTTGTGALNFWLGNGATSQQLVSTPLITNAGTWYHVAFVYNPTAVTLSIYINGVLNASAPVTAPVGNFAGSQLLIGKRADGFNMDGKIDDLRIWNKVRTATEIANNYQNCITTPQTGLSLYYKFDDGVGSTTAADASGNGLTGTVNSAAWVTGNLNCTPQCSLQMSATPTVTINPLPTATTSKVDVVCVGGNTGSITVNGAGGTPSYQYSKDGGVSYQPSNIFSGLSVGNYSIYIKDANNCSNAVGTVSIAQVDGIFPTISCPAPVTVQCASDVPAANIASVTASDNCSYVVSFVSDVISNQTAVNKFTITRTYKAVDPSGNTSTCTQIITVDDNIAPVINCNQGNISVTNTPNQCGAIVTFPRATATDNCSGGAFNNFNPGEPNNAGGEDYLQLYNSGTWNDLQDGVGLRYLVEFNSLINTVFPGYSNIGQFNGHTYYYSTGTNTWTGARAAAQSIGGDLASINTQAETAFLATYGGNTWVGGYQDHSDPSYVEPGNASQNFGGWKWVDGTKLGAGQIAITQISGLASGSLFPIGNTTVTWQAVDESGNTSNCSFTVTVTDNQAPTITCPSSQSVIATSAAGAVVTYATPVGADNCPGYTVTQTGGPASGTTFPLGTTAVSYRVTDAAGLTANCSFNVTVTGLAPAIVCPANISVNNTSGQCGANVTYAATETTGIPASTITYSIASGSNFAVGTTTVTATATNAVGSSSCTFTVTVLDVTPPQITCVAPITLNNDANACGAVVTFAAPTATDNCSVPLAASQTFSYSGTIVNWTVPAGVTSITVVAKGAQGGLGSGGGNNGGASMQGLVNVTPGQVLKILVGGQGKNGNSDAGGGGGTFVTTASNSPVMVAGGGGGTFKGSTSTISQGTTGTCGVSTSVPAGCAGNGGGGSNGTGHTGSGAGLLTNSFTDQHGSTVAKAFINGGAGGIGGVNGGFGGGGASVTNGSGGAGGGGYSGGACGNSHSGPGGGGGSFNVGTSQVNAAGANLGDGSVVISYNVSGAPPVVQTAGLPSGSSFPVGTTTNTFVATDASGNTSTCSFTVTVVDNQLPTITAPANISVNNDGGNCSAVINIGTPTTGDNCGVASVTNNHPSNVYPVGTTTVTWTVTDIHNNTQTATQTVTVTDNEKPVILNLPANIVVNALNNNCSSQVGWTKPTATDNCSIASFTSNNANYEQFGSTILSVGVNTITYTATDIHGNTTTASFTVTVVDNQPPIITGCPSNIVLPATAGRCDRVVIWNPPTASDNCPGVSLSTNHVSGEAFSVGTTTVTYTATDHAGLVTLCSFTVTIVDDQLPVIVCPANINVSNTAGKCGATLAIVAATATDNCPGVTVSGVRSDALSLSSDYPIGTTTIVWTATDVHNNSVNCTQTITVTDTENPVITCAANVTHTADAGVCSYSFTPTAATATDNCPGVTVNGVRSDELPLNAPYPVGTTTILWTATDIYNHSVTCSQTIIVTDNQLPTVITQNITVQLDANGTASFTAAQINNGSTDNCGIASMTVSPNSVNCSDVTLPPATNTQTIVSDNSWKESTTSQSNPNYCSTGSWSGVSGALPSLASYTITPTINAYSITLIPGTQGIFGLNDVRFFRKTFTLTSLAGIKATLLTAMDNGVQIFINGVPVAFTGNLYAGNFNGSTPDRVVLNSTGANVNGGVGYLSYDNITSANASSLFVLGTNEIVLALANCNGNDRGVISFKATIETTTSNAVPVTLTVTDIHGNVSSGNATVTVVDNIAPAIVCPGNINAIATSANGAVVTYTAPIGTDNCTGVTTTMTAGLASGSTFPIGATTVTYLATDASGNTATCSFTVTVVGVPPVIVCPVNIVVNNTTGQCGTLVSYAATETTAIPASTITYSIAPGSFFSVGTTTVTATATNAVGSASCSFTVTVTDNEKPIITCPAGVTVNCDGDNSSASTGVATATDNCTSVANIAITQTQTSTFSPFVTSVLHYNYVITRTWTAKDVAGNSSSCVQLITVQDITKPVITFCPPSVTLNCQDNNGTGATGVATATDNCSPVTITNTDLSTQNANVNNAGYYNYTITRTWRATDVTGNYSECVQVITVQDITKPVLTVPANIDLPNDPGVCGRIINFAASATDNCSPVAITYSSQPGTVYPVGTTTVTVTAKDISGNTTTNSFTIKVVDNEAPVTKCKPVTITLVSGVATITAASVNNGSTDNCGIDAYAISKSSFNCSDIGNNDVVLTVTDIYGNSSSCTAVVTVVGEIPKCSIASIPTNTTYTGGVSTNLYLGYGAQSTTLAVTTPASGAPYTYSWSGPVTLLSSSTSAAPVFTPVSSGQFTFTVVTTNKYGCTTSCSITICVTDIRVPGTNGSKVNVCHLPPGNPGNPQTLSISVNAVPAHLGNHAGDRLGSCSQIPCSGTSTNAISQAGSQSATKETVVSKTTEEDFTVQVAPNPSTTYFTLKLESKYETPVNMRVMDASGRVVDAKSKIGSNSTIQVGHNYISGTYFAELIQGTKRKVVQLIKSR